MEKRKLALTAAVALAAAAATGSANGAIIINEISSDSFNTPTTDYYEFIELYSTTGAVTDLSGLTIVLVNGGAVPSVGGDDVSYKALDLDGLSTNASGYFVFGTGAVAGAQNTSLLTTAGNILQNGPDAVALYQGDATSFPNGTAPSTTNLVDAIVYGTADAPDPFLLALLGETVQYDEGPNPASDAADFSLSRIPNGADSSPFVLSNRTPGATNVVPEPATLGLLGVAGLGLLARRRRA